MPSNTTPKKTTKKAASEDAPASAQAIPTQQPDPNSKYAPNAWVSGGIGSLTDLEVPSGQLCLVRRPGVEGLIKAGVLKDIDSLSAIVGEEHIKKAKKGQSSKKAAKVDAESLMKDPAALDRVLHTVDKIVCHVVVQPEVHMTPNDVTRRKPDVVYADMIDLTDKMFIFNFAVGGSRDLESFREGLERSVGGLETGEDVSP